MIWRNPDGEPGVLPRTWYFWYGFATGGDLVPSPEPALEPVPGRYDVGAVVKQYSDAWLSTPPYNHATPIELLDLLLFLDDITQKLEAEDLARRSPAVGPQVPRSCEDMEVFQAGYAGLCRDLQRWRARLNEYLMIASSVPDDLSHDRRQVLWEITAPLFLGWYGGETGTEVPLVQGGFAPGFNPELRHPPDIAAPYQIANELDVWIAWEGERRQRLIRDVTEPFKKTGRNLAVLIAVGAVLYGGYRIVMSK